MTDTDRLLHAIDSLTAPIEHARQMREAPDPFAVGELADEGDVNKLLWRLTARQEAASYDDEVADLMRETAPPGYVPGESYDVLDYVTARDMRLGRLDRMIERMLQQVDRSALDQAWEDLHDALFGRRVS